MRRRLFTILSAVSLVLCVATCVLWVRSYWVADSYFHMSVFRRPSGWYFRGVLVTLDTGGVGVQWTEYRCVARIDPRTAVEAWKNAVGDASPETLGLGWEHQKPGGYPSCPYESGVRSPAQWTGLWWARVPTGPPPVNYAALWVVAPYWMPAVLFATLPAARLLAFAQRRRRHTRGCCPACNYDLRATPRRCPECGAVPAGR